MKCRSNRSFIVLSVALLAACNTNPSNDAAPPPGADKTAAAKRAEAASDAPKAEAITAASVREQAKGLFQPLPDNFDAADNPHSAPKEALGRALYFDTRLSKNHDVSCNSCHQLDAFGVDNLPTSPGHKKQLGGRNSPTVYNAAAHIAQFWDGRAADVEAQAKGPVLNPVEMAMPDEAAVVRVLKSIPGYEAMFAQAFPSSEDPITYDHMAQAIGAFERRLTTPSRWDAFLKGDDSALTQHELEGFVVFSDVGCTACHNGVAVGGNTYQKLGAAKPWPNTKDLGRFAVTQKDDDTMMFKAPSLRNIEKTGPYFHDGSVATLDEAVRLMAEHQLGRTLEPDQRRAILAWLKTLTGKPSPEYIARPTLPKSGPETPKPDPS